MQEHIQPITLLLAVGKAHVLDIYFSLTRLCGLDNVVICNEAACQFYLITNYIL